MVSVPNGERTMRLISAVSPQNASRRLLPVTTRRLGSLHASALSADPVGNVNPGVVSV
jgi:hypothetical protein